MSKSFSPDQSAALWAATLQRQTLNGGADDNVRAYLRTMFLPFTAPDDARAWQEEIPRLRQRALDEIYLRGFSEELINAPLRVVWGETLQPDSSYRIRKLRYEIYPNYWIPSLLYEPANLTRSVPVMLNPNGHHWGGKAVTYKQARCVNLARRDVIALNMEFIGMGELQADVHHDNIAHVNLTGLAGVGLFYLALKKAIDLALSHPFVDPTRVGITGLSGGGWQTIILAALDERITLAAPVSGYTTVSSRIDVINDIGDLEQAPPDMTTVLDYSHLTAMCAPRPFLSVLNEYDDIFRTDRTRFAIYDSIKPTYQAFQAEAQFEFYSSRDPGTHCYDADIRRRLYEFLAKHWDVKGSLRDVHREDEILPESLLNVGLPAEQTNLLEIARSRARKLAVRRESPRTAADRQALRERIAQAIRLPQFDVAQLLQHQHKDFVGSEILHIGPFEVPFSWKCESAEAAATLIIDDAGRAGHQPDAKPCLTCLVPYPANAFIPDILGFGENRANDRLLMVIETVGQRLLGIQVAQIHACAERARQLTGALRIQLASVGPASSLASLIAAGLRPDLFESLNVMLGLTTISHLSEWGERWERFPSMFCFGLLEVCDVPQLALLLENVRDVQAFRHVK